jgi:hypothetical protein
MAIALDLAPTLTGFIAGESSDDDTKDKSFFALSPVFEFGIGNYSIGARVDLVLAEIAKVSVTHFGMAALARWYPLAKLQKSIWARN